MIIQETLTTGRGIEMTINLSQEEFDLLKQAISAEPEPCTVGTYASANNNNLICDVHYYYLYGEKKISSVNIDFYK
jgi:hypothetical protein